MRQTTHHALRCAAVTIMLVLALILPGLLLQAAQILSSPASLSGRLAAETGPVSLETNAIPQMPGYPVAIGPHELISSHEELGAPRGSHGVVHADLDGDGNLEVVYSTFSCSHGNCNRGRVWAWDHEGNAVPGFPVMTIGGAEFTPSIADLDGDGDQEIVQVTENIIRNTRLYVIDHLGNVLDGFPIVIAYECGPSAGTTLYDLDQDGVLEIIFTGSYRLHVFEIDGSEWLEGWPLVGLVTDGTPAVGDIDNDGTPEIFVKGGTDMHLIRPDGSELEGWPREAEDSFYIDPSSAIMADFDGDLDLEIMVTGQEIEWFGGEEFRFGPFQVRLYHHDGSMAAGWPVDIPYDCYSSQAIVTDLEGDGVLDIVRGGMTESYQSVLLAWDATGASKPGFPILFHEDGGLMYLLTAADVNGDGLMEIFGDSSQTAEDVDNTGYIFGFDAHGNQLPGFPLRPHGRTSDNGAIIEDIDRDGDYELAAVSINWDEKVTHINLYDLPDACKRTAGDWLTYHGDNSREGVQKRQYRGWRFVYAGGRMGR